MNENKNKPLKDRKLHGKPCLLHREDTNHYYCMNSQLLEVVDTLRRCKQVFLSELCAELDLPSNTVTNYLITLSAYGLVTREQRRARVGMGHRMLFAYSMASYKVTTIPLHAVSASMLRSQPSVWPSAHLVRTGMQYVLMDNAVRSMLSGLRENPGVSQSRLATNKLGTLHVSSYRKVFELFAQLKLTNQDAQRAELIGTFEDVRNVTMVTTCANRKEGERRMLKNTKEVEDVECENA